MDSVLSAASQPPEVGCDAPGTIQPSAVFDLSDGDRIRCPFCKNVIGRWVCSEAVVRAHVRGRQKRTIIGARVIICERCGGDTLRR